MTTLSQRCLYCPHVVIAAVPSLLLLGMARHVAAVHPDPPASALTSPAAGVESVVLAGGAPRQDGADNGGAA